MTTSTTVVVSNKLGLHARASGKLVEVAMQYTADITLSKSPQTVDAKNIIQVLMLGASIGTELVISADGADAESAVSALVDLFQRKFDEEA